MRSLIVAAICAASFAVSAGERVAKAGRDEIRLFDSACIHAGTMALIKPEHLKRFKKATANIGGQYFYGCWADEEGVAFILFEDGDQVVIPLAAFKEAYGV